MEVKLHNSIYELDEWKHKRLLLDKAFYSEAVMKFMSISIHFAAKNRVELEETKAISELHNFSIEIYLVKIIWLL